MGPGARREGPGGGGGEGAGGGFHVGEGRAGPVPEEGAQESPAWALAVGMTACAGATVTGCLFPLRCGNLVPLLHKGAMSGCSRPDAEAWQYCCNAVSLHGMLLLPLCFASALGCLWQPPNPPPPPSLVFLYRWACRDTLIES